MKTNFSHDATGFTVIDERCARRAARRAVLAGILALLAIGPTGGELASAAGNDKDNDGRRHHLIDHKRVEEMHRHRGNHHGGGTVTPPDVQAQVTDLQNKVASLTGANASMLTLLQTAQGQITALQTQVAALGSGGGGTGSSLASLAKYVTVDLNPINGVKGPHVIFTGANIHIRSGSGATDDGGTLTGLGNLIVGYNELPNPILVPDIGPCDRALTGSHNIVGGTGNVVGSYGGFVAGQRNCLSAAYANVLGGTQNEASGVSSTILGGFHFDTFNLNQTVPVIR